MMGHIIEFISNLSLETLLIGITLPILSFIIQLVLRNRDKQTAQITFIENKSLSLLPLLNNKIDGLEIKYYDKPITGNLAFYQLTIYNSGVSDISKSQIHAPLCIQIPKGFQWKSYKLFDKSEEFDPIITISYDKLIIDWELFKKGEFIRINTIIEHSQGTKDNIGEIDNLLSNISFNKSRIVNLNVQKANIRKYDIFLRNLKTAVFFMLSYMFIMSIINNNESHVVFKLDSEYFKNPVEFKEKKGEKIVIIDSNNTEFEYLSETEQIIKNVYILEKKRDEPWGINAIFILVNVWGLILFEQLRIRKKRERIRLVSKKPWNQFEIEDC